MENRIHLPPHNPTYPQGSNLNQNMLWKSLQAPQRGNKKARKPIDLRAFK